ncbi:MAG: carbohydrate ABC transporter permease [Oscillospiraceae bacterium]|jgi:putative aldouronate transport system permease protein|nr:carbohydrate ABC transporter permease [Oscillospiraceae bacterium]
MVTGNTRRRNAIRKGAGETAFDALNITFMLLMALSIIYPFWNLALQSLNDGYTTINTLRLWPVKPTLFNYEHVLTNPYIWSGYRETLIRTVFGTALNLAATILGAYALSKPYMPGRKLWMLMVVIPMFFGGGIIPTYLWNVQLGLRNTRWSLILPGLVNSYNMIVMRNFFQAVPKDLEESARIDGAANLRILISIYLPVSTAVLATITLWIMVSHWNAWFDATIYINKAELYPLQVVLRRILLEGTQQLMDISPTAAETSQTASPNNIKAACVFVCMLPIMCVYPFLQKYFVKGTLVGAIKG